MARYIDAEKLRQELDRHRLAIRCSDYDNECSDYLQAVEYAIRKIEVASTADVEEVRHGEWKLKSEIRQLLDCVGEDFYVECPICHRIEWVPYMLTEEKTLEYAKEHYPYCHCGARMGGKTE